MAAVGCNHSSMVVPLSSTNMLFSLRTFLQAKPPALGGFARLGYHGWRSDITKCHVCAKGAACSNNDGVAVLTGRERACCGSCSLAAPDGGHEILSYYVSHSGPFSPSLFFPLVSLAHLLTPPWTSVVISRHFTAKRHSVHGDSSFCRTQWRNNNRNPAVVKWEVGLSWYIRMVLCYAGFSVRVELEGS